MNVSVVDKRLGEVCEGKQGSSQEPVKDRIRKHWAGQETVSWLLRYHSGVLGSPDRYRITATWSGRSI